jgi:ubiquinone/menaquinone biosynthesis C-methylase UbiE
MNEYPEKYVPATLPVLPFKDQQFDLVLSAHFLFTYSDRLSFEFHCKTIQEFMRVAAKEIRISF